MRSWLMALGLTLVLAMPAIGDEGSSSGPVPTATTPDHGATPNPLSSAEAMNKRRIEQVQAFIKGEVPRQHAALRDAAHDEDVKALFRPFLRASLWQLEVRGGHFFTFKKKSGKVDQMPTPLSYKALKKLGVLSGTGEGMETWFKIATHDKNDRGHYSAFQDEAEKQRYKELYRTFFMLADFWRDDGTLAP